MANPYRAGTLDVNTVEGRKLWNKATAGLSIGDRYDLSQEKISDFKEALDEVNNKFAFDVVLNAIPFSHNADGTVSETASLLESRTEYVPLTTVADVAEEIWGNTNVDRRIDETETDPMSRIAAMRS